MGSYQWEKLTLLCPVSNYAWCISSACAKVHNCSNHFGLPAGSSIATCSTTNIQLDNKTDTSNHRIDSSTHILHLFASPPAVTYSVLPSQSMTLLCVVPVLRATTRQFASQ